MGAAYAVAQATTGVPTGPLFCVLRGPTRGRPCAAAAMRIQLHNAARAGGIRRRFAPHQLRHAHAVEMSREGVPPLVIQRQLVTPISGSHPCTCAASRTPKWSTRSTSDPRRCSSPLTHSGPLTKRHRPAAPAVRTLGLPPSRSSEPPRRRDPVVDQGDSAARAFGTMNAIVGTAGRGFCVWAIPPVHAPRGRLDPDCRLQGSVVTDERIRATDVAVRLSRNRGLCRAAPRCPL